MSSLRRKAGSVSINPTSISLPSAEFSAMTVGGSSPGPQTPGIAGNQAGMSSNVSLSGTTVVDIHMGNATNALAAKTASLAGPQTLFEMCSETRRRLRRVKGYDGFIALMHGSQRMDVMQHVWRSFRLGTSLCHLFNMLLPTLEPDAPMPIAIEFPNFDYEGVEGRGVFAWMQERDNIKKCKKGAANFIMRMTELKKSNRWPEDDALWNIMELFGDDTGGLKKVLQTVITLLDRLPDSAWEAEEGLSPMTPFRNSSSYGDYPLGPNGPDSATTAPPLPGGGNGHSRNYSESQPYSRPGSSASTLRDNHSSGSTSGLAHKSFQPSIGGRQALSINTTLEANSNARQPMSASAGMSSIPGLDLGPMGAGAAAMAVWEILKTEKKYVSDLEVLQAYAQALLQHSIVAPDTVHMMFSNLGKLLDFQRRFLTRLETEYEPMVEKGGAAWIEGNWGLPFLEFEHDFGLYDPYCANYMSALELVEKEGSNLNRDVLPLTVPELNAYLIIPIQRICRYPLLLDALIKGVGASEYAYKGDMIAGHEVTKRMAESVNETIRQNSNINIVAELQLRVKDWKGHHISEFGNLLLEGRFMVTKGDLDRDYEVYLFEKMILCCKEILPDKKDKRAGKNGSILKKQTAEKHISGPPKKNLLSLKGRIYVNNLTHIERVGNENDYALAVYWRQQENPNEFENFVLHVKNTEQFSQWETAISKLMAADRARREQRERDRQSSGSTRRYIPASSNFAATPASEGPASAPLSGGYFDRDASYAGWDDDLGTPSTSASSTPFGGASRRTLSQQGVPRPPDRYSNLSSRSSHDDPNGMLMAQWRNQQGHPGVPPMPMRHASDASVATETSFGNAGSLPRSSWGRHGPPTKLARVMSDDTHGPTMSMSPELNDVGQEVLRSMGGEAAGSRYAAGMAMMPRAGPSSASTYAQPPTLRTRSASSPHVYQANRGHDQSGSGGFDGMEPLPEDDALDTHGRFEGFAQANPSKTSLATDSDHKRSSNRSSRSTESSEMSSHSPKTPYDGQAPDSARIAAALRGAGGSGDSVHLYKQNVIVKVHSPNAVFKLAVPVNITCEELKIKVARKVQTCVGSQSSGPLKCYYRDEDDDRLLLNSAEDLLSLFEPFVRGAAREVELEVKQ